MGVLSGGYSKLWAGDIRRAMGLSSHQHRRAAGHRAQARWTASQRFAICCRKIARSDAFPAPRRSQPCSFRPAQIHRARTPARRCRLLRSRERRGPRLSTSPVIPHDSSLRAVPLLVFDFGNGSMSSGTDRWGGTIRVACDRRSAPQQPV